MGEARRRAEARQRREDAALIAAIAASPTGRLLCTLHLSLTGPEKTDATIIVDGDAACVTLIQEPRPGMIETRSAEMPVSELRHLLAGQTSPGCVLLILPINAAACGAIDMLAWLRRQGLNVMTMSGDTSAALCVARWRDIVLRRATAAGEA